MNSAPPATDPANSSASRSPQASRNEVIAALVLAIGLTIPYWPELWGRGGMMGGDSLTYFYPQKTFLSDRLMAGEVPLWNNLVSAGYPLVGESQTALFYPTTLPLYLLLDANSAFNVNMLIHYVLAFVATWLLARRLGIGFGGACLAALVFTYGWFPVLLSYEWAITTGAWLPLVLWCAESWLQSGQRRWVLLLPLVLALQLLAGHFSLAFITQLALIMYVPLRLRVGTRVAAPLQERPWRSVGTILAALLFAFPLAGAQLVPTWELRQLSDRQALPIPDAEYGRVPFWYLGQMFNPWHYYSLEFDINSGGGYATNEVAAHLYLGLLPLALLLAAAVAALLRLAGMTRRYPWSDRLLWPITLLGIFGLLYATGLFMPVTKYLPGFGYFVGPGRYGALTILAGGLIAAASFEWFTSRVPRTLRLVLLCTVSGVTFFEYDHWNRTMTYSHILEETLVDDIPDSDVRALLRGPQKQARVFARGQNIVSCLGIGVVPGFVGMSPAAYVDPQRALPEPHPFDVPVTPEQLDWLQRAGVTHVLAFELLDETWPATLIWTGRERFLSVSFYRPEPLYLYALQGSRGRIAWVEPHPGGTARIVHYRANTVVARAASPTGGRLVLTDLAYPGWSVTVDGAPAESLVVDGMYRGVDVPPGEHTVAWSYRPRSVTVGLATSAVALLLGCGFLAIRSSTSRFARRSAAPEPGKA